MLQVLRSLTTKVVLETIGIGLAAGAVGALVGNTTVKDIYFQITDVDIVIRQKPKGKVLFKCNFHNKQGTTENCK